MRTDDFPAISRELLQAMADVFGPSSPPAQALSVAAEMEKKGKNVEFLRSRGTFMVKAIKGKRK